MSINNKNINNYYIQPSQIDPENLAQDQQLPPRKKKPHKQIVQMDSFPD